MDVFKLQKVEFVPCNLPVHRDSPDVSVDDRLTMLQLMIKDYDAFAVNPIEVQRGGLSWSVDTLHSLKQQNPSQSFCWMMGADTWNGFSSWKQPQKILQLAHVIVCLRPGVEVDTTLFNSHHLHAYSELHQHDAGKIVFYSMHENICSSTRVRSQLVKGLPVDDCLSPAVIEFIRQNNLYNGGQTP